MLITEREDTYFAGRNGTNKETNSTKANKAFRTKMVLSKNE
nr:MULTISPECIES: hypothetical protein [unclassified Allomuricauda]